MGQYPQEFDTWAKRCVIQIPDRFLQERLNHILKHICPWQIHGTHVYLHTDLPCTLQKKMVESNSRCTLSRSKPSQSDVWGELQERCPQICHPKKFLWTQLWCLRHRKKMLSQAVKTAGTTPQVRESGARVGVSICDVRNSRCFLSRFSDVWLFHSPRCLVGWSIRIGYLMNESKTEQELDIMLTNNWKISEQKIRPAFIYSRRPFPFSESTWFFGQIWGTSSAIFLGNN